MVALHCCFPPNNEIYIIKNAFLSVFYIPYYLDFVVECNVSGSKTLTASVLLAKSVSSESVTISLTVGFSFFFYSSLIFGAVNIVKIANINNIT